MLISIIVAMDENRGIGKGNRLPWRLSADLKRFKALTLGHHVLMGYNTYLSLKGQSPERTLPGRQIIVVSEPEFHPQDVIPNVIWVSAIQAGMNQAQDSGDDELFIGGGASIYAQCLSLAQRVYLTRVHTICQADAFFPDINFQEWILCQSSDRPADEKNEFASTFQLFERPVP